MYNIFLYNLNSSSSTLHDYIKYFWKEIKKCGYKLYVTVDYSFDQSILKYLVSEGIEYIVSDQASNDYKKWNKIIKKLHNYGELEKCDNLILLNDSIFGPFSSLSEILKTMCNKDCDFWGITKRQTTSKNETSTFIDCYFICFKKNIIQSKEFISFWDNLTNKEKHSSLAALDEKITKYFCDLNFIFEVYTNTEKLTKKFVDISDIYYSPTDLLALGCPFLKTKYFTLPEYLYMDLGIDDIPSKTIKLIEVSSDYPVSNIENYLISSLPPSRCKQLFQYDFVGDINAQRLSSLNGKKIALVLHVYFEDLIDKCISYVLSMHNSDKIVIVSSNQKLLDSYSVRLAEKFVNFEVRFQKNRGRNESAYFITCKDILLNYDYVCLAHDKKLRHAPVTVGEKAFTHCFDNCLGNKSQVNSILNLFENHNQLGILCPPTPCSSIWKEFDLLPYSINREDCVSFVNSHLENVKLDPSPIPPIGSVFWVRKGALEKLLALNLTFEDMPKEPLPLDGSFLHVLERLYPSIAQSSGFCTGWILSSNSLPSYLEELNYNNRQRKYFLRPKTASKILIKIFIHKNKKLWNLYGIVNKRKKEIKKIFHALSFPKNC